MTMRFPRLAPSIVISAHDWPSDPAIAATIQPPSCVFTSALNPAAPSFIPPQPRATDSAGSVPPATVSLGRRDHDDMTERVPAHIQGEQSKALQPQPQSPSPHVSEQHAQLEKGDCATEATTVEVQEHVTSTKSQALPPFETAAHEGYQQYSMEGENDGELARARTESVGRGMQLEPIEEEEGAKSETEQASDLLATPVHVPTPPPTSEEEGDGLGGACDKTSLREACPGQDDCLNDVDDEIVLSEPRPSIVAALTSTPTLSVEEAATRAGDNTPVAAEKEGASRYTEDRFALGTRASSAIPIVKPTPRRHTTCSAAHKPTLPIIRITVSAPASPPTPADSSLERRPPYNVARRLQIPDLDPSLTTASTPNSTRTNSPTPLEASYSSGLASPFRPDSSMTDMGDATDSARRSNDAWDGITVPYPDTSVDDEHWQTKVGRLPEDSWADPTEVSTAWKESERAYDPSAVSDGAHTSSDAASPRSYTLHEVQSHDAPGFDHTQSYDHPYYTYLPAKFAFTPFNSPMEDDRVYPFIHHLPAPYPDVYTAALNLHDRAFVHPASCNTCDEIDHNLTRPIITTSINRLESGVLQLSLRLWLWRGQASRMGNKVMVEQYFLGMPLCEPSDLGYGADLLVDTDNFLTLSKVLQNIAMLTLDWSVAPGKMWLRIQDRQANESRYWQMEQSANIGVDPIVWASICHRIQNGQQILAAMPFNTVLTGSDLMTEVVKICSKQHDTRRPAREPLFSPTPEKYLQHKRQEYDLDGKLPAFVQLARPTTLVGTDCDVPTTTTSP